MDAPFPDGMMECIKSFFKEVHPTLTPGQNIYNEVFKTDLFFPLQRQAELRYMMNVARSIKPRVVMEIGADKGGGLYHWCQCLPSVKVVIACEIRGTPYAEEFIKSFPHIAFRFIPKSSYDPRTVSEIKYLLDEYDERIDCLFIDGDKTKFLTDFNVYLGMMNKPSYVFMHDVNQHLKEGETSPNYLQDLDPNRPLGALNYIRKNFGYVGFTYVNIEDTLVSLDRQEKGIPPANAHEGWLRHWKGDSCGVGVLRIN